MVARPSLPVFGEGEGLRCAGRVPKSGNGMRTLSMQPSPPDSWHGTTILTVRKGGIVAIGGDGQVSIGQTIVKANAKKVRRLAKGDVIGGFPRATPHPFPLFQRLRGQPRPN